MCVTEFIAIWIVRNLYNNTVLCNFVILVTIFYLMENMLIVYRKNSFIIVFIIAITTFLIGKFLIDEPVLKFYG